jgi:glycosyltransferase involved in cell wall biosynthesis
MKEKKISFVIPCYRSENTIEHVIDEIIDMMNIHPAYDYEIIAVNDRSPDNVICKLYELAKNNRRVKAIDLAKNMGKHAAMMAGYSKVTGDIIVNLDDDGQCPLDQLWNLLEPLDGDADISIAKYPEKKESWFKRFGSGVNTLMARMIIGKPKDLAMSNFSAMKRFVCEELIRYQNAYPYIDGLFLRTTSNIKNVEMEERERASGTTGYTFLKSLKLWVNGFTTFSVKPLRLATVLGSVVALIGFIYGLYIIVRRILNPEMLVGYSSLMAVLLFVSGIIMLMLGLIGEYIGRIYISINNSPQYVIRDEVNFENDATKEEVVF